MKLTAKNLKELILEVINESRFDKKPSAWTSGYTQGDRDAKRLALKGGKQSAKGLRAYIQKATEDHPNEKWKQGYAFAFQLMFSAQLTDPIPDGQLPYANARSTPSGPFRRQRGRNPLKENETSDYDTLMDMISGDDEGAIKQALFFYESGGVDLTPEELEKFIRNLLDKVYDTSDPADIIFNLPEEFAIDWHGEFEDVYGIAPPRSLKFELIEAPFSGHQIRTTLEIKGKKIFFGFYLLGELKTNPTDPFIFLQHSVQDGIYNVDSFTALSDGTLAYETSKEGYGDNLKPTKEQVPGILRKAIGIEPGEAVPEWPALAKS